MKRFSSLLLLTLFASLFFVVPSTQAAEDINIISPKPQVTIPGLEFSDPDKLRDQIRINEGEETTVTLQIPFIGQYISAIYRYAVAVAAIIAIVMIIVAGFQWAFSGGSQDTIGSAKKRIINAVTGLVLVAASYTILYTINPDLVRFRSLSLTYVEGVEANLDDIVLDIPGEIAKDTSIRFGSAPPGTVPINDFDNVVINKKQRDRVHAVRSTVAAAFKRAVAQYNRLAGGQGKVVVNSSFRTPDQQYAIMVDKCKCDPVDKLPQNVEPKDWRGKNICKSPASECGVASYSIIKRVNGEMQTKQLSHLGAFALDINAFGTRSAVRCNSLRGSKDETALRRSAGVANVVSEGYGPDHCIPKSQQLLIKAMLDNGFCVGLGGRRLREPWHFEHLPTADAVGKKSSFCVTLRDNDPNLQKLQFVN